MQKIQVPEELKPFKQWVGYDKNKIPQIVGTAQKASTKDRSTWRSFDEAIEAYKAGKHAGIGFVFCKDDPFCFIDLDHCIDESGNIEPESIRIVDLLNSYTEISQSGSGMHIIVKAGLPKAYVNHSKGVEMYHQGRYCALTGNLYNGYPSSIETRQEQINTLFDEIFGKPEPSKREPSTSTLSDQKIIDMASRAKSGDKFRRLFYDGDTTGYPSESEADLALVALIAFYTKDRAQIIRIVKQSGLYDEKWQREDYQTRTIAKALSNNSESYKSPGSGNGTIRIISESEPGNKIIKSFHLTDIGNCERLVHYHGESIRYCEQMKTWFIWDGRRWKSDDCLGIERLAKETVRKIYSEAGYCDNENQRKLVADHAKRSEANNRIQAMISLARSEPGVIVRVDDLDHEWLYLNCENGTIDLRTGELLQHRKEDHITKIIPVIYDKMSDCPRWEKFLDEIFLGDKELIRFIKYAVGYSLTTSIKEQCFFICYGTGANGKSVFLDTIEYIMGDYGRRVNASTFEERYRGSAPSEDIAGLKGTRYISTIETGQDRRFAENLVKQMTGDTTTRARFLYQNSFEFDQTYKIWIATNHKPVIRGTDEGIWRRVRLIPFEFTIVTEKQNRNLLNELKEESSGILMWAIEGCLTWQGEGLHRVTPQKVLMATNSYRIQMDSIGTFLREYCTQGGDNVVGVTDLYEAFAGWSGEKISRKNFNIIIEDAGYKKVRHGSGVVWQGLCLNQSDLLSSG